MKEKERQTDRQTETESDRNRDKKKDGGRDGGREGEQNKLMISNSSSSKPSLCICTQMYIPYRYLTSLSQHTVY